MENATIKKNGDSYFVKLPAELTNLKDCIVTLAGDTLILTPKDSKFAGIVESLAMFSEDIFEDWEEDKI